MNWTFDSFRILRASVTSVVDPSFLKVRMSAPPNHGCTHLSPESRTGLFSGLLSGNLPVPFNFGRNNLPLFQQE